MNIGINGSRIRSGGGVAHLKGILQELKPEKFNIKKIHLWSYPEMLNSLPRKPWLVNHAPFELEKTLARQIFWERFILPKELKKNNCEILLNLDAGSVCKFSPAVTMSRDMLSYEPKEIKRYGLSKERLRLILLRYIQNSSFRSAKGVIFLTNYASRIIQNSCGKLLNTKCIPHGIGEPFRDLQKNKSLICKPIIRCLYVSNTLPYKHQWHVVEAISLLKKEKIKNIELELVGGGEGSAQIKLEKTIEEIDPNNNFIMQHEFVSQKELPSFFSKADIFIFASSCENMPNTLLEAMASGIPIACSDTGPMPEVLKDGGLYFNPEDPKSIAKAICDIVYKKNKPKVLSSRSLEISKKYSWSRCCNETFSFIKSTLEEIRFTK